jgi:hypothetical protein
LRRNDTPIVWRRRDRNAIRQAHESFLLQADRQYQLNTRGDFFYPERHLKIDNAELEPNVCSREDRKAVQPPTIASWERERSADSQGHDQNST